MISAYFTMAARTRRRIHDEPWPHAHHEIALQQAPAPKTIQEF
jgi:hypothetical protein